MEQINKVERIMTSFIMKIQDINVNFNYENLINETVKSVNASFNIKTDTEFCNVNMSRQSNNQQSCNINGNKNIVDLSIIIIEIETEMENILNPI